MVYPHNTFDAETAKAWVGEGGMKQYFKEGEEKEVDDDNAYDMNGGVLEADGVNYDSDNKDWNDYNHDTDPIDANVMNNDEPEGRIRSIRRKVLPARLKECMF